MKTEIKRSAMYGTKLVMLAYGEPKVVLYNIENIARTHLHQL